MLGVAPNEALGPLAAGTQHVAPVPSGAGLAAVILGAVVPLSSGLWEEPQI